MARILVVDDDPDILISVRRLLASAGHDVFTADGAMAALDVLNQNPCDLVLTDANMPHHSGFDLVKTLRNDSRFQDMAIAMLTARREKRDIEQAVKLGADDYIVKPVDPVLLINKVQDMLVKKPADQRPGLRLSECSFNGTGRLAIEIEIISISELGLVLQTPQAMAEGSRVSLECTLFTAIGIEPPMMKVLSSLPLKGETRHETRLNFIGTNDNTLQKIRAWIVAHTPRAGMRAA